MHGRMAARHTSSSVTMPDETKVEGTKVSRIPLVVFTATYYESTSDLRYRLCVQTIAQSVQHSVPLVVVDGSRSEDVRSALRDSGVVVRTQTAKGRKGAALREAASIASGLPGVDADTLLCWQEPEKVGMIGLWREVQTFCSGVGSDVVVPWRDKLCFRETYPREQVHSESFGNLYLDTVLKDSGRDLPLVKSHVDDKLGDIRGVDWHFGPFAFRSKHIGLWVHYKGGDSYDAQVVPLVHAFRKGLSVSSVSIRYRAPQEMKEEEEGDVDFIEKRLWQLNDLDPRVKKAWTEETYC